MAFSDTLSRFVRDRHLNQASVARDMGISGSRLNAIVNGKQKMDIDEFFHFCKTVNVDPEYLLDYDKHRAKTCLRETTFTQSRKGKK